MTLPKNHTSSQTMELSQNENYEVTDKEFKIWIGKKLNEMKENIYKQQKEIEKNSGDEGQDRYIRKKRTSEK